jgi:hypothetical protein
MNNVFGAVGAAGNHEKGSGNQRPQRELRGFLANSGNGPGWDSTWEGDATQFLSLPPWEAAALSVALAERLRHRRIQVFVWRARKIRIAAQELFEGAMAIWSGAAREPDRNWSATPAYTTMLRGSGSDGRSCRLHFGRAMKAAPKGVLRNWPRRIQFTVGKRVGAKTPNGAWVRKVRRSGVAIQK